MSWTEPEVAVPVPMYTGHPIEEPPEGGRRKRRRAEDQEREEAADVAEVELNRTLETDKTDGLRQESDIRPSLRRSRRRQTDPEKYRERPPSPEAEEVPPPLAEENGEAEQPEPKKPRTRRTRRTKSSNPYATLPHRETTPNGTKQDRPSVEPETDPSGPITAQPAKGSGPEIPNNDFCAACGGLGDFVCCETCPRSFHFLCVDPPLSVDDLPGGAWYCRECDFKRKPVKDETPEPEEKATTSEEKLTIRLKTEKGREKEKREKRAAAQKDRRRKKKQGVEDSKKANSEEGRALLAQEKVREAQKRGLFGEMLEQLEKRNPQVFRLPASLQHRFEGVIAGPEGEFINEFELPPKKPRDREENLRLEDQDEKTILCFKCSNSALKGPIIHCYKCKLPWHIDCLDPPQFNLPTRWVCPNHVENAAKIPRRMRKQLVKDTVLRRGHKNNGLIEVWDDEDQVTPHTPPLIGDVKETEEGFSAKMAEKQRVGEIPRVPARSIKLDFIDFVHGKWRDPWRSTQDSQILKLLNELVEQPAEDREAVRNLAHLQLQGQAVDAIAAEKNLDRLVQIALDDRDNDQALAIKKLLQVKGREKLLQFLQSDD